MKDLETSARWVIAGNWKMYKTRPEAISLMDEIILGCGRLPDSTSLLVFPPFCALGAVAERCRGTRLGVGAQNLHPADEGAFTGEVSAPMILEAGASHVLIGHSERRRIFLEADGYLAHKLESALRHGLTPVFCVGETMEERDAGATEDVISRQVRDGLRAVGEGEARRLLIAYEPVWAIGTGRTATPAQAREVHGFLRGLLTRQWGEVGGEVPLLYGGSVKPSNAGELLSQPEINGVLVGGASLEASSFLGIAAGAPR